MYDFMMCQRMGCLPTSTIGLGRYSVSSLILTPIPPARMTTFIKIPYLKVIIFFKLKTDFFKFERVYYIHEYYKNYNSYQMNNK